MPDVPQDPVTPAAPREVELKLFVPPSSVARLWSHPLLLAHAAGPLRVERIDNRYFDTAERDLAQRRMALRLRRIGRRWLQTLKRSSADEAAMSTRSEWEMPVAGPVLELARFADTPLAEVDTPAALAVRLRPLFTTNFRRESRLLRLDDGSTLEFAFDTGLIETGRGRTRRSLPICEVEIEVRSVPDGVAVPDLMRFAARLVDGLALIPLAASKAARGHRLVARRTLEPVAVVLPVARADDAARVHLARVLDACNAALLANAHALFERDAMVDPDDVLDARIEFVHRARVAIRRMRSALRTFRPVASGRRLDALDDRLRAMGRVFGAARDHDVFATVALPRLDRIVASDAAGRAALDALAATMQTRRVEAHRALMQWLETGDFGATTIAISRAATRLADAVDGTPLGDRASAWLRRQRRRVVARARRIAVLDTTQRHALRIEVKRLRYALDLFDGLHDPRRVADFRDALAAVQDRLGRLNDAAVADATIETLGEGDGLGLARARHRAWLDRKVRDQLPKLAAAFVALELTPVPWRDGTAFATTSPPDRP